MSENSNRLLVIWDNAANGPGLAGPAVVIHLKSRKISVSELRVTNAQMNHGNSNKSSAKFHQSPTPPTLSSSTAEPLSSTLKLQSPQDNRLNSTISSILTRSKLKLSRDLFSATKIKPRLPSALNRANPTFTSRRTKCLTTRLQY